MENTMLSVSRLVEVDVSLSPQAAANRPFGILMIVGDSDVISAFERYRSYNDIDSVAADFGTTAPEYLAAELYFGQLPKPETLMIGRWLQSQTKAFIKGGALTAGEKIMTNWTVIETGAAQFVTDFGTIAAGPLDFSETVDLNGVAEIISDALAPHATCTYDGSAFTITSSTEGVTSTVGYAIAPVSGLDISGLLKLTFALANAPVAGRNVETPVECAAELANRTGQWFGLMFAADAAITTTEHLAVAALCEAASPSRVYGITCTDSRILDTNMGIYSGDAPDYDIPAVFLPYMYKHTVIQYSTNKYAVASLIGRAFSVNFTGNNTVITLMYKQEPGVVAEYLTSTQADNLASKRCNVFVMYQNNTAIIQNGVMSGPCWIDEMQIMCWYQDYTQTAIYNALYTSATKVPQTDIGSNQIVTVAGQCAQQAVANGAAYPGGVWTSTGFGNLKTGDVMPAGYYIYVQPMALQNQADREARKMPVMQQAIKLAGAIHTVDCKVNFNR